MICGGTISGNCASGSPRIAMRPARTVTIAITIATIGRRIKKFEIICPREGGVRERGSEGAGEWGTGERGGGGGGGRGERGKKYLSSSPCLPLSPSPALPLPTPAHLNGIGLTTASGLTFWTPSATTLSPGFSPSSIIHIAPMRSPTLIGRMLTLLSLPTTAIRWPPCSSETDRCGTSNAPLFMLVTARTRPY